MPKVLRRPRLTRFHRRKFVDVLFNHPFELALSLVLLLLGARSLIAPATAPSSIATQPDLIHYVFLITATIGGALTLAGLFLTWRARGLEQAGLYLSAAAWLGYVVGLAGQIAQSQAGQLDPTRSGLLLSAVLALAVSCVVRSMALTREERAVLSVVTEARQNAEAADG